MNKKNFSKPGCYRIKVDGILPENWFNRLGSMHILDSSQEGNSVEMTIMEGKVADQAELSGILNSLYELHLPLLSVQFIGDEMPEKGCTVC